MINETQKMIDKFKIWLTEFLETTNDTVEKIVTNLVDDLQIKFRSDSATGKVVQDDLIDIIRRFRMMGLNYKFFLGLYVTPRSEHNNRNILEVRWIASYDLIKKKLNSNTWFILHSQIRRPILSKDLLFFDVTEDTKSFADSYIRLIIVILQEFN